MKLEERHYAETAREYALRMLKENIISMELKPGAMVSENELAAQLGLSRTPVREALMDMAQYGLVDILPQRGSRISLIDYALVEEARFAREVLEVAILSIVCENVTEESLVQLRQNVRQTDCMDLRMTWLKKVSSDLLNPETESIALKFLMAYQIPRKTVN